jgi:hypothetical protein
MLKQVLKVMIVPLVLLALASPAWAGGAGTIILDPPISLPPGMFGIISIQGADYSAAWGSCTQAGVPMSLQTELETLAGTSSVPSDSGCVLLINETGAAITDVTLTITLPDVSTLQCLSIDPALTNNTCPSSISGPVTVDFSGGQPIPDLGGFIIAELGEDPTTLPPLGIVAADYDPSTLVLLAAGMAFLAMGAVRRIT